VNKPPQYLIGADGGGTGTRVLLASSDGQVLGRGSAGPSGLAHGIANAWSAIVAASKQAFVEAGLDFPALSQIAIGCGLAGVHNKQWAAQFEQANPGFARVAVATDAYTTLLGAHRGEPGAIIALGTGSVGEVLLPDGSRQEVGGWGFPAGDEASGSWLGMRAVNYVQKVLDGRVAGGAFADAVIAQCGGNRDAVQIWLAQASQTTFAQLAPLVIAHAGSDDAAFRFMQEAGVEVDRMAAALDPLSQLPIALCGGLASALKPYLAPELLPRIVQPQADSATGALLLLTLSHAESTPC
jgi:glucosamine kinase